MQRLSCLGLGDLRTQLVDDLGIVRVQTAVDHNQGVGVGLAQQILCFVDLISGIDGNQYRAQLGGGPEGDKPGRHIGGPNGNLRAGLHAQGHQRSCESIHIFPKLGIGAGIVQGGVLKAVLIRELLCYPVQHLGEGQVDQLVLFPDVLTGAVVVKIERFLMSPGGSKPGHIVNEIGEDDLRVLQVLQPFRLPFQRDKAVIIDRGQRQHYIGNGHCTFTDELIHTAVVRVTQMNMSHIRAQILDGGIAAFTKVPVGVMHIPQSGQVVAGKPVQDLSQPGGVGIDAAGFDQQGHTQLLGGGQKGVQLADDCLLVVGEGAGYHIADLGVVSHFHQMGKGLNSTVICRQVNGGVKAGDRQLLFP